MYSIYTTHIGYLNLKVFERYFSLCTPITNLFYCRSTFFYIRSIILLSNRLKKKIVYGNNYCIVIILWIGQTKPDAAIFTAVSFTIIIINRHFYVLIIFRYHFNISSYE